MEPIYTDDELSRLLQENWPLLSNSIAEEMNLARIIRDAVEDRLRNLAIDRSIDIYVPVDNEYEWGPEGEPQGRKAAYKNVTTGEYVWTRQED